MDCTHWMRSSTIIHMKTTDDLDWSSTHLHSCLLKQRLPCAKIEWTWLSWITWVQNIILFNFFLFMENMYFCFFDIFNITLFLISVLPTKSLIYPSFGSFNFKSFVANNCYYMYHACVWVCVCACARARENI